MQIIKNTTKPLVIILLLFLYSCAGLSSEERIQQATAHYKLGISYLNDNNIQPAFVELQKSLELNYKNKEAHNALGIIYLQKLEDYDKAIFHFKEALRIDKNYAEAANNLGTAYAKSGRYTEAIEYYKQSINNPQYRNTALALNNLGMVYYRIKKFDEAIEAFKEALKRYSDFHLPFYGLALCYNAKGMYGDAANAIAKAIENDPLYRGDRKKEESDMLEKKLKATGEEEKDLINYLEILKY